MPSARPVQAGSPTCFCRSRQGRDFPCTFNFGADSPPACISSLSACQTPAEEPDATPRSLSPAAQGFTSLPGTEPLKPMSGFLNACLSWIGAGWGDSFSPVSHQELGRRAPVEIGRLLLVLPPPPISLPQSKEHPSEGRAAPLKGAEAASRSGALRPSHGLCRAFPTSDPQQQAGQPGRPPAHVSAPSALSWLRVRRAACCLPASWTEQFDSGLSLWFALAALQRSSLLYFFLSFYCYLCLPCLFVFILFFC